MRGRQSAVAPATAHSAPGQRGRDSPSKSASDLSSCHQQVCGGSMWRGRAWRAVGGFARADAAACSTSCCSLAAWWLPARRHPSIDRQGLRPMKAALLLLFAVVPLAAGQGPPTTYTAQLNASNEASACRGLQALACAPPPSACCTEGVCGDSPPAFAFGHLPTLSPQSTCCTLCRSHPPTPPRPPCTTCSARWRDYTPLGLGCSWGRMKAEQVHGCLPVP